MQHYFQMQYNVIMNIDWMGLHKHKSENVTYNYKLIYDNKKDMCDKFVISHVDYKNDTDGMYITSVAGTFECDTKIFNSIEPIINYYNNKIDTTDNFDFNQVEHLYCYKFIRYLFDKFTNANYTNYTNELILEHPFFDCYKINKFYLTVIVNEYVTGKKLDWQDLCTIFVATDFVNSCDSKNFSLHLLRYIEQIIQKLCCNLPSLITYIDDSILRNVIIMMTSFCKKKNRIYCDKIFCTLIITYDVNYIETNYIDLFLTLAIELGDNALLAHIVDYCIDNAIDINYKQYILCAESVYPYVYLNEKKLIDLISDVEYYLTAENISCIGSTNICELFNYIFSTTDNINNELMIRLIKKIISEFSPRKNYVDIYEKMWPEIFATYYPGIEEYYRKLIRQCKTYCRSDDIIIKNKISRNIINHIILSDKLVAYNMYDQSDLDVYEMINLYEHTGINIDNVINEIVHLLLFESIDDRYVARINSTGLEINNKAAAKKYSITILLYLTENYKEKYFNHCINLISLNIDDIVIMSDYTIMLDNTAINFPNYKFTDTLNPSISILSTKNVHIIKYLLDNYYIKSNSIILSSAINKLVIYFSGYLYTWHYDNAYASLCNYILLELMKKNSYTVDEFNLIIDTNNNRVTMSTYNNCNDTQFMSNPTYAYSHFSRDFFLRHYKTELSIEQI
jgi:hypothetical protein